MKRIILHLGADKCGSSSIQSYLSRQPRLRRSGSGDHVQYCCLREDGLLHGSRLRRMASSRPSSYVNSRSLSQLNSLPLEVKQQIHRRLRRLNSDCLLSNEGWLRASRVQLSEFRNTIGADSNSFELEAFAFVRAPVTWLNSAWWQWGAWQQGVDFDSWLDGAIPSTMWARFVRRIQNLSFFTRLRVQPMRGDVVEQTCRLLNLDYNESSVRSNTSLPAAALALYQQFPQHRAGQHECRNDYVILHAIRSSPYRYPGTPWVLTPEQIQRVLTKTRTSNQRLIGLMSSSWADCIAADARWWKAEAYQHLEGVCPDALPRQDPLSCFHLASDLSRYLLSELRVPSRFRVCTSSLVSQAERISQRVGHSADRASESPEFYLGLASDSLHLIDELSRRLRQPGTLARRLWRRFVPLTNV